jgi:predicted DNA-binding protein
VATKVMSATVDEVVAERLDRLAAATNRKKSYYVNEALKSYLEEIEDNQLALERMGGKTVTIADARKQLGI